MKWTKVVTNIHGIYRNNRQTLWKSENLLKSMQEVARPSKKPDVDNIIKIVLDGLNGIAYDDDKQVVYASCKKMYGTAGEIWVCVEEDKA